MDSLIETVRAALLSYAKKGLNSDSRLMHSEDNTILSVVTIVKPQNNSFISLLVRVLADTIIIERDQNDKPLVDALLQAGIPRSQIILAYAGEPVPESA